MNHHVKISSDLYGYEGLLVAVIATATKDALSRNEEMREDARAYFAGDTYRQHLGLLGLDENLLPEALESSLEEN